MTTATPACEEFEIAALRRARGSLDAEASTRLAAHLGSCAGCRGFAATAEATEAVLRGCIRCASAGRNWERVRAAFRARRRTKRNRGILTIATLTVIVALNRWSLGPDYALVLAVFLVMLAVIAYALWLRPAARRLRRAEAIDSELLAHYRGELDEEIKQLRDMRAFVPWLFLLCGGLLTAKVAISWKEHLLGHGVPDLRNQVTGLVTLALIFGPMWYRGRFLLPQLERERRELDFVTAPDAAADTALLARVRSGGAARATAFDELFVSLREQVFAVCLHVTGNAADADDALQETFLAVHAGLAKFRGEARISTWVHRIAIRAAIRVRSRRPRADDVHAVDPPARGPDPVLAGELGQRVAAAMERLSAEHRVVISLFAVDGLSHAQIGEILGVPEGTVWSRLHAARKRLAAELGDVGG